MSKKNIINTIFCTFLLIYILLYRFFVYPKLMVYSESISTSFLILMCGVSFLLYGYRKYNNTLISRKSIRSSLYSIVIYFIFTYTIGLFAGFLNNAYSLKPSAIIENAICPFMIIIASELIRYNFVKNNKDNKLFISIITILLFLFNINFYIKVTTFDNLDSGFEFITTMMIPQLISSVLFTYMAYHANYKAPIIYRAITELYVYILPIQPDLNPLILSIANVILPFSVLLTLTNKNLLIENRKINGRKAFTGADIPFAIAAVVLVCTIYGLGPYKMLGIETASMQPNYNVGDAVIIDKNFDPDMLKVGDVIAYENVDNVLIIHRIVKINSDKSFITKGDNNNMADSFYVQRDKIVGCVKVRIPYLAYPALLFK